MIHILVIEDDRTIREGLCDALELEGYRVSSAADGLEGLRAAKTVHADLVLLDLMLPGMNGYELCRQLRQSDRTTPVIMLTAKGEELDKVLGLELGADDYVTKPFGLRELFARIGAVLRRSSRYGQSAAAVSAPEPEFAFGCWTVDGANLRAGYGENSVRLTRREVDLLKLFAANPNRVLRRDFIMREVWGNALLNSRTLDQHLVTLRRKLELPGIPLPLETVYGAGYRATF